MTNIFWEVIGAEIPNHVVVEYTYGDQSTRLNVKVEADKDLNTTVTTTIPSVLRYFGITLPSPPLPVEEETIDLAYMIGSNGYFTSNQISTSSSAMLVAGTCYAFKKDGILPEHRHRLDTLHNIEVVEGQVLVQKETGNVVANVGDVIDIQVNEKHSVIGLADFSRTVHWLK